MKTAPLKILIIIIVIYLVLAGVPVSAVKSAEQSVGDTLTRGGKFTVNLAGIPNSSYYIWIPHTASMSGERYDQPPFIADSQANVAEDPEGGPWPIGSYQFSNGAGMTIRDDIPPSTTDMPDTRYYALVTTDSRGLATVEFDTSVYTGLRSYSVKVENPRSVDSDTLMINLEVFTRRAPAGIGIYTTPQTELTTIESATPLPSTNPLPVSPASAAVVITSPPAIPPGTTAAEPVPTRSADTPVTPRSPPGAGTAVAAIGIFLLIMRRC